VHQNKLTLNVNVWAVAGMVGQNKEARLICPTDPNYPPVSERHLEN